MTKAKPAAKPVAKAAPPADKHGARIDAIVAVLKANGLSLPKVLD